MTAIIGENANSANSKPALDKSQTGNAKGLAKLVQTFDKMVIEDISLGESERTANEQNKKTNSSGNTASKSKHDKSDIPENPAIKEKRKLESIQIKFEIWKTELEEKLWNALLNWQPSERQSLAQNIEQLQQIYEALKIAILQYTTADEQLIQLTRLEEELSQILGRLLGLKADDLIQFLIKYNQNDTIAMVNASLYKLVTKEKLFPKDALRFVHSNNDSQAFTKSTMHTNIGNQAIDPASKIHNGSIYQKTGNRQISAHPLYRGQNEKSFTGKSFADNWQNAVKLEKTDAIFGIKGSWEKAITTKLFPPDDLVKVNQFIKHISKYGQPFSNISKYESCEELLGLATGILALKAQVFCQSTAISSNMSSVLKHLIDEMIIVFLYNEDIPCTESLNSIYQKKPLVKKDTQAIFKIYNYILKAFHDSNNIEKALSKGIQFALKLFSSENENDSQYFFDGAVPNKYISLKEGLAIIRNNWNQFVHSSELAELGNSSDYELDLSFENLSLWGADENLYKGKPMQSDKSSLLALNLVMAILTVICIVGLLTFSSDDYVQLSISIVLLLSLIYSIFKTDR